MNKNDIIEKLKVNPRFFLGTVENNLPKVRGMLVYSVDENGIIFHTSKLKDLYKQLLNNTECEVCFLCSDGTQIRIIGTVEEVIDKELMDNIFNHPSRGFLRKWKEEGKIINLNEDIAIFKFNYNKAVIWNMDINFQDKKYISML